MIGFISTFFTGKKAPQKREYSGFSDFFLHATPEEQKRVMTAAAQKANEDQLKVIEAARLKVGVN